MATNSFNPQADLPQAKDFLNYSKGFQDNGLGNFLGNAADTLDTGLKAIDRGVAQMSQDEVRSVVEDTDTQLLGVKNQGPRVDPLQIEVRNQVQNLSNKKLAMDAGTIDPQHYYATIQAQVKDIRARYSGYNDEIDEELRKLGIDPNWQRKEIIAEGLRAQEAKLAAGREAAKNDREFTESAINNPKIVMPPEFRARLADPTFSTDPKNMKQLKMYILQTNDIYSRLEMDKTRAEVNAANSKDQGVALGQAYGRGLNTIFYAASKNGGAYDLVKKATQDLNNDVRMGRNPSEDETALRNAYRTFRTQMEAGRAQMKAQFSDSASLFPDEMKKQDDAFTSMLDNIDKSISNKDWGSLGATLAAVETMINGARLRQLDNSAFITSQAGMKANLGDQATSLIVARNLQTSPDAYSADSKNAIAEDQVNAKSKSLIDDIQRYSKANPEAKGSDYRDVFQNSLDMILHPEGKSTGRLNVFEALFGENNQGFWDNIMQDDKLSMADKRAYYRTLTSPQMIKAADELAQYDPRTRSKLYSYTTYMFYKMNKDSVSDINDTIVNSSNATVVYDPASHNLKVIPVTDPTGTGFGQIWDKTRATKEAVDTWNTGVNSLIPQWEKQGIDVESATQNLMSRAGINLNAPKQGNTIDRGINAVVDWFTKPIDESQDPSKLGGPGGNEGGGYALNLGNTMSTRLLEQNDVQGTAQELRELYKVLNTTTDPETRKFVLEDIQSLRNARVPGNDKAGPFSSQGTLTPTDRGEPGTTTIPKNIPAQAASPASTFQPRGAPNAQPTDADQQRGRDAIDALTSVPSFVEAVKKGDLAGAALAAATIIPFPAGKALKAGERAVEGGAKVIDAVTLEARRADKGMAEIKKSLDAAARESAGDFVGKMNRDQLDQFRMLTQQGMAEPEAYRFVTKGSETAAKGIPSPEELTKLTDDGLNKLRNMAMGNLKNSGLSKADRQSLNDFVGTIDDELIRRNSVPYTPAMDRLSGLREEALTQKVNDIKTKGGTLYRMGPDGKLVESRLSAGEMKARANGRDLRVIEGGGENPGTSNARLRFVDEPTPKDLSARYNPDVFTTAGTAQRATQEELTVRSLLNRGFGEQSITRAINKGDKYVIVDNNKMSVVGSGKTQNEANQILSRLRKKALDTNRYSKHKVD